MIKKPTDRKDKKPLIKDVNNNVNLQVLLNLFKNGQVDEAIALTQQDLLKHPNHPSLHNFLGVCLSRKEQLENAAISFKTAVDLNPVIIDHIKNLYLSYVKLGRQSEAEQVISDADVALNHSNVEIKVALGEIMMLKGNINAALLHFNSAQKLDGNDIKLRILKGLCLERIGAFDAAKTTYIGSDEPLSLQLDLRELLGSLYGKQGFKNLAIELLMSVINENPNRSSAYRNISKFLNFNEEESFLTEIELKVGKEKKIIALIDLNFALAKAYNDIGNKEYCFAALKSANDLQKTLQPFSIGNERRAWTAIKNINLPVNRGGKYLNRFPQMVFVVGMPRSGTSLIEQILSQHPEILAGGEQEIVPTLMARYDVLTSELTAEKLNKIVDDYAAHIALFKTKKGIFVDKLPNNYRWIKFLKYLFPTSRFIYLKRDPIAACWSNYFHYFKAKGMRYATDLQNIADYYQLHEEIMKTWKTKYPADIYEIQYELFTENYHEGIINLLNFLSLEIVEECFSHSGSDRVVNTASSLQAREKVYTGSSEKWKTYEAYLGDLVKRFS